MLNALEFSVPVSSVCQLMHPNQQQSDAAAEIFFRKYSYSF